MDHQRETPLDAAVALLVRIAQLSARVEGLHERLDAALALAAAHSTTETTNV